MDALCVCVCVWLGDAAGGDVYLAVGASLFTPLPKVTSKHLKGHLFVNAGSLRMLNHRPLEASHVKSTLESLYRYPSVSVGAGLVYWHSVARFELNFCLPLMACKGDRVHSGFQFGFGINFL